MRQPVTEEEKLVAELELLGIRYLSRATDYRSERARPPAQLLADLIRQPSARVRQSVISVLLAHPKYASAVPEALGRLSEADGVTLRLFYTAAVILQRQYADQLQQATAEEQSLLPDLFSRELGLSATATPAVRLTALAKAHRRISGITANWAGTYDNVARKLLRRWEMERQWSQPQSLQKPS